MSNENSQENRVGQPPEPVSIERTDGGKLRVDSPYSDDFVSFARNLGADWDGSKWEFDARDEDRLREKLVEVYGTDGSGPVPLVDVVLTCSSDSETEHLNALGRTLIKIKGRDTRPALGEGVALTSGSLSGGGSRKYPAYNVKGSPATLEVRDVPLSLAEEAHVMGWDAHIKGEGEEDGDGGLTAREEALVESLLQLPEERITEIVLEVDRRHAES